MKLHLGVAEIPYAPPTPRPPITKAGKVSKGVGKAFTHGVAPIVTTGEVAEILEEKYHVMRIFFELHGDFVAKQLEDGLAGALESMLMGAPVSLDPFGAGCSKIEDRMKQFLTNKEMEQIGYPGVPTKAALAGVSHRFKHPYGKHPRRPSFIDTGIYQSSMKAWID